ncbi:MAG: hypothetical protein ACE5KZ_05255 [Candidatus Scalinduaceae bacterium]
MNTEYIANLEVNNYENYLQSLKRACSWAGISRGRAVTYIKLVRELFEAGKDSREHILAYNESCEITDIFEFWESHVSRFPGLKGKIKKCLGKGATLRENEKTNKFNRPRNDAFAFLLAGNLMRANIKVIAVDGIVEQGTSCHKDADITFEWTESVIDVECKRPQTDKGLEECVKKALQQLARPSRPGQLGIIAIDCSVLIRPPGKVINVNFDERAVQRIHNILEVKIKPKVNKQLESNILGSLLFARVPRMTPTRISSILSPQGKLYIVFRPESITSILCINNPNSCNPEIFRSIYESIGMAINNTAS